MEDEYNEIKKSKCFIYLRRSQDREDRQQLSLEKQDTIVRRVIARNKLSPIRLPAEERSAKYPGRPIFNDMMKMVENLEIRYIACWALSRLSRNPVDGGRIIHALDTGKLLAIYTPEKVYRNTSNDKMSLAIELAFAKRENDNLGESVKEGFDTKRRHGQYPGPAPLGYINVIIRPGERNIAPDPKVAPKVVNCFKMASEGKWTLDDIWKYAIRIDLKSRRGNVIGKQTLSDMLQRRLYTGVFQYGGGEWHIGTYQALISAELFNKVQVSMGWRKAIRKNPSSTSGRSYPYKGLFLCGTCKFNVTAYTKKKKLASGLDAEYVFYTCTKKSRRVVCEEPQVRNKELEEKIKSCLSDYEITEKEAQECRVWVQQLHSDYIKKKNNYKSLWLRDNQRARRALDVLDEKLELGIITDERYKLRAAKHEEVLARTTQLIERSISDAEAWLELSNKIFSSVVNISEVFEQANEEERRELMKYIGSNWYLSNKKVVLTPRKPLDLLSISDRNPDWRARPDLNRRSPP
ncbi:MAG TPA: recombinase family protein [Patescibacteria group bacterium]|nr:recombinase family protein [Patescibacteria group bacterium]